jgi:hypothetical protein
MTATRRRAKRPPPRHDNCSDTGEERRREAKAIAKGQSNGEKQRMEPTEARIRGVTRNFDRF